VAKTYYDTLGLTENASPDEIKKSFRTLAKKYHPDRNKGDKEAENKFKEISEAYDTLSDPKKKQQRKPRINSKRFPRLTIPFPIPKRNSSTIPCVATELSIQAPLAAMPVVQLPKISISGISLMPGRAVPVDLHSETAVLKVI